MTIQSALEMADAHAKDNPMSHEIWALRVLAGAYRREKSLRERQKNQNNKKEVIATLTFSEQDRFRMFGRTF